ncbi:MAG: ABC transporter substrate-binding protein [Dethiobacteria bacterium]
MKKYTFLFITLIMATILFVGCGNQVAVDPEPGEEAEEATTKIITDMAGSEVEITTDIQRVVNLWPASNAAMLCMGAGDKLVGTTDFTKKLPWSQFVYPGIVDVPTATDNAEELLEIDPDLIITPTNDVAVNLREAGLPAINLMFSNYDEMKRAFAILGDALGEEYAAKAAAWSELVDNNIAEVSNALGDLAEEDKPIVYYIQGQTNQGLYSSFRGNSIMNDWITYGGGIFASALMGLEGTEVTAEEVLALNPDIVIIGGPAQHELYEELMADDAWKDINAVKNNRVYTNPNGLFPWERFGMESALQIKFAASVIHPDLYQVDMIAEVQDFYREFVGIELTDEQAQNMINGYGPYGE